MKNGKLSRRDFLRVSAMTTAGLVAAGCVVPATEAPPAATEAPAAMEAPAEAPPAEEVTLDVMTPASEYDGASGTEIVNVPSKPSVAMRHGAAGTGTVATGTRLRSPVPPGRAPWIRSKSKIDETG